MGNVTPFRWEFLVLDDHQSDGTLDKLPGELGDACRVVCVGAWFPDLYRIDDLIPAPPHVVLIDMKWQQVRSPRHDDALALVGPEGLRCGPPHCACKPVAAAGQPLANPDCRAARAEFTRQWLDRVRYARHTTVAWLPDNETIRENAIGLWLSAWVSHLYPTALTAIYTAFPDDVRNQPGLAPWLRFRTPHTELFYKDANQPLPLADLAPTFRRLQLRELQANPELREWAQRVWLGEFLGTRAEPLRVAAGPDEAVEYRAEAFFPQLTHVAHGAEREQELRWLESVAFAAPRASAPAALHAADHVLRRAFNPAPFDDADRKRVKDLLYPALPVSGPVIRLVDANECRPAWRVLQYILRDGLPLIARDAETADGLPTAEPTFGDPPPPGPRFPLDVELWEQLWEVLRANPDGESYRLHATLTGNVLDLRFVGGRPFASAQDFLDRAAESLAEKGGYRGLPLLVRCASQWHARTLEVAVGGAWVKLKPGPQDGAAADPAAGGIRMTFTLAG